MDMRIRKENNKCKNSFLLKRWKYINKIIIIRIPFIEKIKNDKKNVMILNNQEITSLLWKEGQLE